MPKARILDNRGYDRAQIEFPHVVKVHNSGSTIGVHYIDSTTAKTNLLSEWVEGIRIVEEFLDGPEGVIVIYKGEVIDGALVNYSGPLFDYNSKYDPQLSKLEPWDSLPATTREEVTQYGLDIYDNCQCSGFLSVEFRLKNGAPYILEANGIPGMTKTSLVPYTFARRGIGFKTLVELMIAEYRQPKVKQTGSDHY
jgi:D-alanine-D-alanine ligase